MASDGSGPGPYTQIGTSVSDHVLTITLDRPEARNAYTLTMADELAHAFVRADADDEVRVVVLAGEGRDFCVGMDLSAGGVAPAEDGAYVEPATRVTRRIWNLHKPVIAAVHGAAAGVGATMTLPCDYRLAADDARFGFVFARRGLYPEGGSVWFLPRLVGLARATDWMISGRVFPAAEAHSAGLVHALHPAERLRDEAHALARDLATHCSPLSMAVIRQNLLRMGGADSPDAAFALDSRLIAGCATSADTVEGISSFLEKRDPRFPLHPVHDVPDFVPWRDEL